MHMAQGGRGSESGHISDAGTDVHRDERHAVAHASPPAHLATRLCSTLPRLRAEWDEEAYAEGD